MSDEAESNDEEKGFAVSPRKCPTPVKTATARAAAAENARDYPPGTDKMPFPHGLSGRGKRPVPFRRTASFRLSGCLFGSSFPFG